MPSMAWPCATHSTGVVSFRQGLPVRWYLQTQETKDGEVDRFLMCSSRAGKVSVAQLGFVKSPCVDVASLALQHGCSQRHYDYILSPTSFRNLATGSVCMRGCHEAGCQDAATVWQCHRWVRWSWSLSLPKGFQPHCMCCSAELGQC